MKADNYILKIAGVLNENSETFLEDKRADLVHSAAAKIESAVEDLTKVGLPKTFGLIITELKKHAGNLRFAGGMVADESDSPTPM